MMKEDGRVNDRLLYILIEGYKIILNIKNFINIGVIIMRWTFEELKQLGYGFVSGSINQKYKTI